jgi:hypothetical protein
LKAFNPANVKVSLMREQEGWVRQGLPQFGNLEDDLAASIPAR